MECWKKYNPARLDRFQKTQPFVERSVILSAVKDLP